MNKSRTLWKTVAYLSGKKIPSQNAVITFNGKPSITPQQKATAFNEQFVNTVKHTTNKMNRKVDKHTKPKICPPILITQAQVRLAISNSSLNSSNGPDGVNIRHLKHLGPKAIQHLTHLFNKSLNTNIIPHIWKLAKIIPIPKQSQTKILVQEPPSVQSHCFLP